MSTETNVTPAQELRAAAAKIRDAAHWASKGPWVAYTDEVTTDWHPDSAEYRELNRDIDVAEHTGPGNAAHIALWHPGVAETVAEMFEVEANALDRSLARFPDAGLDEEALVRWPLRIARAINGGAR